MKIIRFLCVIMLFLIVPPAVMAQTAAEEHVEIIPDELAAISLTDEISQVRGMQRLINNCQSFPVKNMDERIENYNEIFDGMEEHIPTYLYLAESSRTHPLAKSFPEESEAYLYLKQHLHVDTFNHLAYSTFEEYCRYFYTTDHHWNYRGSYQAYLDIVHMLKGEDEEVMVPEGTVTFPVIFNGSYSKNTKEYISDEYFTIYQFADYPKYSAIINGRRKTYDHIKNYLKGVYNKVGKLTNHYGQCYGGDYGMIVFDNAEKTGKGTLLMFGNSLSNAVKTLLIAHYDRIVYIDLRYYAAARKGVGKTFSMSKTVNEYHPDQILLLGDVSLFTKGIPMKP